MAERDMVRITHPDFPGVESKVPRAAFDRRSSKLGWVLADSPPGEIREADNPGHTEEAHVHAGERVLTEREQLVVMAESLGLRVHPRAKPETIRKQIEKAKADL